MPPGVLVLLKSLKYNALTLFINLYCSLFGNKMQKYQNSIPRLIEKRVLKLSLSVGK
jgi:hypothetical protein